MENDIINTGPFFYLFLLFAYDFARFLTYESIFIEIAV